VILASSQTRIPHVRARYAPSGQTAAVDRLDVGVYLSGDRLSIPDGAPDDVVRTVSENARTLKFEQHGFEQD
jgi:hypothetical protein